MSELTEDQLRLAQKIWGRPRSRPLALEPKGFFQRLFCKHRPDHWLRNIYGDEIHARNGNRSTWQCTKCGAIMDRPELMQELEQQEIEAYLKQ